jgi:hypothetical protein
LLPPPAGNGGCDVVPAIEFGPARYLCWPKKDGCGTYATPHFLSSKLKFVRQRNSDNGDKKQKSEATSGHSFTYVEGQLIGKKCGRRASNACDD